MKRRRESNMKQTFNHDWLKDIGAINKDKVENEVFLI